MRHSPGKNQSCTRKQYVPPQVLGLEQVLELVERHNCCAVLDLSSHSVVVAAAVVVAASVVAVVASVAAAVLAAASFAPVVPVAA